MPSPRRPRPRLSLSEESASVCSSSRTNWGTTSGVEVCFADPCDLDAFEAAVANAKPSCVLIETVSNPMMRVPALDKVAEIQGVPVLNINEMAKALKPQVVPGESLRVEVVKRGESANQGVGYLPDGTMVVIEEAGEQVGSEVDVEVTNSLQTTAGRMIFGRVSL